MRNLRNEIRRITEVASKEVMGVAASVNEVSKLTAAQERMKFDLKNLKGTPTEKIIKLILKGKFPNPDPQKLLKLNDFQYDTLLKRITRIGGDSGYEMKYRTLNYSTSELENWAKKRVELVAKELGLGANSKIGEGESVNEVRRVVREELSHNGMLNEDSVVAYDVVYGKTPSTTKPYPYGMGLSWDDALRVAKRLYLDLYEAGRIIGAVNHVGVQPTNGTKFAIIYMSERYYLDLNNSSYRYTFDSDANYALFQKTAKRFLSTNKPSYGQYITPL